MEQRHKEFRDTTSGEGDRTIVVIVSSSEKHEYHSSIKLDVGRVLGVSTKGADKSVLRRRY